MALPPDVARAVAEGVGAYVRDTDRNDLPGPLRRFAGYTPAGLRKHSSALTVALDDEAFRARVAKWLEDNPRGLSNRTAEALRLACERPEGWIDAIAGKSDRAGPKRSRPPAEAAGAALDNEREKTKRAREDARKAREDTRRKDEGTRARITELERGLAGAQSELQRARREVDSFRSRIERIGSDSERGGRKAQRDVARARAERDEAKRELKEAHRRIRDLEKKLASEAKPSSTRKRPAKASLRPKPPERRKVLPVPKGRFAEDPATLEAWLAHDQVGLVIDGYNVTKAERGFGEMSLEDQRDRLVKEVTLLARTRKVSTTIVFDGSEIPPGTTRRSPGPVKVRYSAPDEIADDYIVKLIEEMPAFPVVVVTNDRELQHRVKRLGATVATSDQLLSLLR